MDTIKITQELVLPLLPQRTPESHKGNYGKVFAYCGCDKYRGAAALSVLGALRTGAGLVTLAAAENVIQSVAPLIPEATFLPMPARDFDTEVRGYNTVLAGCGKEECHATVDMLERIIKHNVMGKLVLDAGGLMSLNAQKSLWPQGRTIITPHMGEMARLTGMTVAQLAQQPADIAAAMAKEWGVVLVLKGHRTLVAIPGGATYENTTGNAGLARGGSGDILAGMIAGLCAQGLSCADAAVCAVWLHGAAADACAAAASMGSMLPHDILPYLASIFKLNEQKRQE